MYSHSYCPGDLVTRMGDRGFGLYSGDSWIIWDSWHRWQFSLLLELVLGISCFLVFGPF